ncbi:MAG: dipeptide epimerase [Firmicutes bacterium]|nr:dipeptide epimerase [Bacillota bacterium]MBQ5960653.1 dipeptide epimerase [Bacillota bacterium]
MKITGVRIGEVHIPLVTPFKTALRSVDEVNDIVIALTTDTDAVGYGEAPPTAVITGDTKGSIVTAIRDFIVPSIVGIDILELDTIMTRLHASILKNTSAKACVDMAVYDLYAKALGQPLYKVLGGSSDTVETDLTISVDTVEKMVSDSIKAVSEGYRILKVKVGKEGLADIGRIQAIREAVGPDVLIRVDANQGWEPKDAVRIIRRLEDLEIGIDLVEQPVKAHDLAGMQMVTQNTYTPILADESIFSAEDAINVIRMRAADLVNIKLMKTGGIYEALKICSIAEIYNVRCMMGCMLESKLAVSAGAHLAAARSVITRADLDGPGLCRIDPYTGGPDYAGPVIHMNQTPGIGITAVPGL